MAKLVAELVFDGVYVSGAVLSADLGLPDIPAYHLMGFDIGAFTPIFVMSRITGWTAHIIEQTASNALIHPLSEYVGEPQRALS